MSRKAFVLLVVAVSSIVGVAYWHGPIQAQTGAAGSESKTVSFSESDQPAPPATAAAASGRRRVFGDRDARRHGITLASVRAALKDLKDSGAIDGTESHAELAVIVTEHIASKPENKASFQGTGPAAPNWDAILAFVEKLIAMIMKFFPMSVLTDGAWNAVDLFMVQPTDFHLAA